MSHIDDKVRVQGFQNGKDRNELGSKIKLYNQKRS